MELIQDFKNRLLANSLTENTAKSYSVGVKMFFDAHNIQTLQDITTEKVMEYSAKIQGGQAKRNAFLIGLRRFCEYYNVQGIQIPKSREAKVQNERIPLVKAEFDTLMKRIDYDFCEEPLKIKALIAMFYYTGMRESEIEKLKREDVINQVRINIMQKKGTKPRLVSLIKPLRDILSRFLACDPESKNLFGMGSTQMRFWVAKAGKDILGKKLFPHILRHTFITRCHRLGMDIKSIQIAVGHSSLEMTERYLKVDPNRVANEVENVLESAEAESGEI